MKYRLGVALAGATLLTTVGGAYASASDKDPKLGTTETQKVDETFTVPDGYACDVDVKIHYTGTETVATSLDGHTVLYTSPDEKATFTNVKTDRSVKRVVDGGFAESSQHNGDIKGYGFGRNYYLAPGVRGIVLADGVQRYNVKIKKNDYSLEFVYIHGHQEQLCKTLGAKAVPGKQLPDDSSSSARRLLRR